MPHRILTALLLSTAASGAAADAPRVVTDTGVAHALVARVMAGVADPARILPPGVSPHDFQLRPSDAQALAAADIVIWMGERLTPWLSEPLETLAPSAKMLELLESPGWTPLPARTDPAFADTHDHGDHGAEEHGAEEHADEGHAEEGHEEDGHVESGHDDHGMGPSDPHAWLDPTVASVWLGVIAQTLADADPGNAAAYQDNAAEAQAEYAALDAELAALLAPLSDRPFVVAHDALHYFETRFGVTAAGAIALTDASQPGPARITALQDLLAAGGIACVLTDTETSPDWAMVLSEGLDIRTAQIDPEGTLLEPGADLYPALMRGLGAALADCLSVPG